MELKMIEISLESSEARAQQSAFLGWPRKLSAGPTNKQTCFFTAPKAQRTRVHTPHAPQLVPTPLLSTATRQTSRAAAAPPAMTTARFVSTCPTRLSSTPTSPISRTSGWVIGRIPAFPARPLGFSLRLKPSPAMAAVGVGGNGSPTAPGDSIGGSCV